MHSARHVITALVGMLSLTLVAGCAGSSPQPSDSILTSPVAVGTVNDAPGYDTGDVNPAGFDVDVRNSISTQLNLKMAPTLITYADRESELKDGTVSLVIATYSITSTRNQEGIDFAGPYMVSPQALLVRAGYSKIKRADDLQGKNVCVVEGSTGADTHIPGATMTQMQTTQDCLNTLDNGNTDAIFTDALILYGYMNADPGKYKVILPGVFGELQYTGIGLKAGHHADCEKINSAVTDFLNNDWARDFQTEFPVAYEQYTGSDTSIGNYMSVFKPTQDDMQRLSCKL